MSTLSLPELIPDVVQAVGAMDFDVRRDGVSPRRLPDWTRAQIPALMDVMARMPSGVRLRFATSARRVGISFHATNMVTPPNTRRPTTFDLESDGTTYAASSTQGNTLILDPADPTDFKLERGGPDTVFFDDLPAGEKTCELWLPHNAFVELRTLIVDDDATVVRSADGRRRWYHYGSSISHCMEADRPALIWPAVAARLAGVSLRNLGFGGQCHLDQFVARTLRDSDADLLSIKTGINIVNMDSMRERVFGPALHGFLDTVRDGKPDIPIVVISPIYCPSAEHRPGPTVPDANGRFVTIEGHEPIRAGCMSISRTREIIAEVVDVRRQAGDAHLHYVNGLDLFGEADAADLPDDLHPNPTGYVRMGDRFAARLTALAG